jgi:hypothetical protein
MAAQLLCQEEMSSLRYLTEEHTGEPPTRPPGATGEAEGNIGPTLGTVGSGATREVPHKGARKIAE